MVSNSGTMLTSSAPSRGRSSPDFLEQHGHFQDVGDAVGLGDHVVGHGGAAVAPVRVRRHAQHGELAGRLLAIGQMRRGQRPRIAQLAGQQRHARGFVQLADSRLPAPDRLDQLGHDARMHVRILPQVERGEMEAEDVDRAAQRAQAAARQAGRAVCRQRTRRPCRGRPQLAGRFIGRRRRRPADAAAPARRATRRWRPAGRRCRRWRADRVRPGAPASGRASVRPAPRSPSEMRTMRPSSDSSPPSSCSSSR